MIKATNHWLNISNWFEAEELELITQLHSLAFLQSLFEDREENLYFRWKEAQTEEFKKDESNCSNKRSDGSITTEAFEMWALLKPKKGNTYNKVHAELNKDLYK